MATIKSKTWGTEAMAASDWNTYVRDAVDGLLEKEKQLINVTTTSDFTTSGTSFADVDATWFQVVLTPNIDAGKTCDILVGGTFSVRCSTNATSQVTAFDLMVNGVSVSGGTGIAVAEGPSGYVFPFTLNYLLTGQSNAAKTIKLRWKTNGGTTRLWNVSGAPRESKNQFWARVL
jgi:hypothetical protein